MVEVNGDKYAYAQQYAEESLTVIKEMESIFNDDVFSYFIKTTRLNSNITNSYNELKTNIKTISELLGGTPYFQGIGFSLLKSGSTNNFFTSAKIDDAMGLVGCIKQAAINLCMENSDFSNKYNAFSFQAIYEINDGEDLTISEKKESNEYLKKLIMPRIEELEAKEKAGTLSKAELLELEGFRLNLLDCDHIDLLYEAEKIQSRLIEGKSLDGDNEELIKILNSIKENRKKYNSDSYEFHDFSLQLECENLPKSQREYVEKYLLDNVEEIPATDLIPQEVLNTINVSLTKRNNALIQSNLWERVDVGNYLDRDGMISLDLLQVYYQALYNKGIDDLEFTNAGLDFQKNKLLIDIDLAEGIIDEKRDYINSLIVLNGLEEISEITDESSLEDCNKAIDYLKNCKKISQTEIEVLDQTKILLEKNYEVKQLTDKKLDFHIHSISKDLPKSQRELFNENVNSIREKTKNLSENISDSNDDIIYSISAQIDLEWKMIDDLYQRALIDPSAINELVVLDVQVEKNLEFSKKALEDFNSNYLSTRERLESQIRSFDNTIVEIQKVKDKRLEENEYAQMDFLGKAWYHIQKTGATIVNLVTSVAVGLVSLVEALGDVVLLVAGAIASIPSFLVDCCIGITGDWDFSTTGAVWKEWCLPWVGYDWTHNIVAEGIYWLPWHKWADNNSYDWAKRGALGYSIGEGIGYYVGILILSYYTAGASSLLIGGTKLSSGASTALKFVSFSANGLVAGTAELGRATQNNYNSVIDAKVLDYYIKKEMEINPNLSKEEAEYLASQSISNNLYSDFDFVKSSKSANMLHGEVGKILVASSAQAIVEGVTVSLLRDAPNKTFGFKGLQGFDDYGKLGKGIAKFSKTVQETTVKGGGKAVVQFGKGYAKELTTMVVDGDYDLTKATIDATASALTEILNANYGLKVMKKWGDNLSKKMVLGELKDQTDDIIAASNPAATGSTQVPFATSNPAATGSTQVPFAGATSADISNNYNIAWSKIFKNKYVLEGIEKGKEKIIKDMYKNISKEPITSFVEFLEDALDDGKLT